MDVLGSSIGSVRVQVPASTFNEAGWTDHVKNSTRAPILLLYDLQHLLLHIPTWYAVRVQIIRMKDSLEIDAPVESPLLLV